MNNDAKFITLDSDTNTAELIFTGLEYGYRGFHIPKEQYQHFVVLDIGANYGAFAVYAQKIWPGCFVISYEPCKQCCEVMDGNINNFEIQDNVKIINAAVWIRNTKSLPLYKGPQSGSYSLRFYEPVMKYWFREDVKTVAAKELPACHVLKVDIEGLEAPVIRQYIRNVCKPPIIFVEWHTEEIRRQIDRILHDYALCGSITHRAGLGTSSYVLPSATQIDIHIATEAITPKQSKGIKLTKQNVYPLTKDIP